ncbi:MAG: CotH kinase family protein [Planctomycetota bacterium]
MVAEPHPGAAGTTLLGACRAIVRFAWRWSLLVTVPLLAIFVLWLYRTGTKYHDLGLHYEALGGEVNLRRIADFEGRTLLRDVRLAMQLKSRQPARQLKPINLFLPGSSEAQLNGDLPYSGRDYVPASLDYGNSETGEVKVRYRGDHYWHWAARKKSLRIKTRRESLYEGMRSFNVVAPKLPEQLSAHMSYFLARQLDLITPRSEMADLYVNGGYRGVHVLLEQLEEMVLRRHDRMPGDIYAADIIGDDAYRGIPSHAFKNPGLWEKIAVNNHFDEASKEPLRELTRVLGLPPGRARSLALRELVDIDAFGRFAAFRALCQSEHYDNVHNWRLYYDPWRNQFEPIVWDPVGWGIEWRPKTDRRARPDIVSSLLDEVLMEDHAFLESRQHAIENYFASGAGKAFLAEVDAVTDAMRPSLATDPGLAYKLEYMTAKEVDLAIYFYRYIARLIFDQLREDYLELPTLEHAPGSRGAGDVRIALRGRRPLTQLTLKLAQPPGAGVNARLRFQSADGAIQVRDLSGAATVRGSEVDLDVFLSAQLEPDPERPIEPGISPPLRSAPGVYEVILFEAADGSGGETVLPVVDVTGRCASGDRVRGRGVDEIFPAPFRNAHAVADDAPARSPDVWEGTLDFDGVQYVDSNVIVRPGTTLRMAPGASVIFEGQLTAVGSAERPIRVVASTPREGDGEHQAPWGTFALRGSGANGSELEHVQFQDGSGLKEPLEEYSAMFSIHGVTDVSIKSCIFRRNSVVDDMVHAVYSSVVFDACGFAGAFADALDLDITEGAVRSCAFQGSGNDALDLMTSKIAVQDSWISGSGDKGISVGENTEVLAVNTSIRDCLIGVQIKDRSRAVLYNCEVRGSTPAVDAYHKNWRYGVGGSGYVYKSAFQGTSTPVTADKRSSIRLHDCLVDERPERTPQIYVDATTQVGTQRAASFRSFKRFPQEESTALSGSPWFEAAWQSVDPLVRGLRPKQ